MYPTNSLYPKRTSIGHVQSPVSDIVFERGGRAVDHDGNTHEAIVTIPRDRSGSMGPRVPNVRKVDRAR